MHHLKIEITGKVQGVYFRKSTKEKADSLGIQGFVENCRDGSVYIEAEGNTEALETFIRWCQQGSEFANVKDVVVLKYEKLKDFDDFEIKRNLL